MKLRSKKTRSVNPGNGAPHHNSKLSPLEQVREAVRTSNLPDLEWTTILGAYQEEGIRSLEDLARKMVETFRRPSSFRGRSTSASSRAVRRRASQKPLCTRFPST